MLGVGAAVDGRPCPTSGASRPRIIRIVVDLPAPLGPRKPVTIAGADGEGEIVDGGLVAVALGQFVGFDHGELLVPDVTTTSRPGPSVVSPRE